MMSISRIALAIIALGAILVVSMPVISAWEWRPREESGPPMFRLPVENPDGKLFTGPKHNLKIDLMGPDHKPQPGKNGIFARATCTDYLGRPFPHCYGNHKGVDFILKGGFKKMDKEVGRVVAAAPGVVTKVVDGNYDRCRMSVIKLGVTCGKHDKKANYVWIKHDGGWQTMYYHFKKNTIAVKEGQTVECGQFLGFIGSSGESSLPHLHFQVIDPEGYAVDPYSVDPAASLWVKQEGPHGLPSETCAEKEE